jgi:hypothetical protein
MVVGSPNRAVDGSGLDCARLPRFVTLDDSAEASAAQVLICGRDPKRAGASSWLKSGAVLSTGVTTSGDVGSRMCRPAAAYPGWLWATSDRDLAERVGFANLSALGESVTYRFQVARVAVEASDAVGPCPILPGRGDPGWLFIQPRSRRAQTRPTHLTLRSICMMCCDS